MLQAPRGGVSSRRALQLLQGQGCAVVWTLSPCHHTRLSGSASVFRIPCSCGWRLACRVLSRPGLAVGSLTPGTGTQSPPTEGLAGAACAAATGCPPGLADCPRMRTQMAVWTLLEALASGLGLPSGPTQGRFQVAPAENLGDWLVLKHTNSLRDCCLLFIHSSIFSRKRFFGLYLFLDYSFYRLYGLSDYILYN